MCKQRAFKDGLSGKCAARGTSQWPSISLYLCRVFYHMSLDYYVCNFNSEKVHKLRRGLSWVISIQRKFLNYDVLFFLVKRGIYDIAWLGPGVTRASARAWESSRARVPCVRESWSLSRACGQPLEAIHTDALRVSVRKQADSLRLHKTEGVLINFHRCFYIEKLTNTSLFVVDKIQFTCKSA